VRRGAVVNVSIWHLVACIFFLFFLTAVALLLENHNRVNHHARPLKVDAREQLAVDFGCRWQAGRGEEEAAHAQLLAFFYGVGVDLVRSSAAYAAVRGVEKFTNATIFLMSPNGKEHHG